MNRNSVRNPRSDSTEFAEVLSEQSGLVRLRRKFRFRGCGELQSFPKLFQAKNLYMAKSTWIRASCQ